MNRSLCLNDGLAAGESFLLRGRFCLKKASDVELRICGASTYQGWLDGRLIADGPVRYLPEAPEYESKKLYCEAGEHVIAFAVQYVGGKTRMLLDIPAFLCCRIFAGIEEVVIDWRACKLESNLPGMRRINPQLGWADARDTRKEPINWQSHAFEDASWELPQSPAVDLPEPVAAKLAEVLTIEYQPELIGEGPLAHTFGYVSDDSAVVFHTRDRVCGDLPAKGRWYRYDLGRVRLGRPRITLELPAGVAVEWAMSESLSEGKVFPWITLSAGASCNMDRFIARGGSQTFTPHNPKGGRFLELHITHAPADFQPTVVVFDERVYHAPSEAFFSCEDPLLDPIWQVGVETYRACSEDALTDNPTRERGQWLGDAAGVGIEIAAVSYHDLSLIRRSLVQAVQSSRKDGLVAGMSTGDPIFLPTYSLMWAPAVWRYFQYTGDSSILYELRQAMDANNAALRAFWTREGFSGLAEWNFIDWGYNPNSPEGEGAVDIFFLKSLRACLQWVGYLQEEVADLKDECESVQTFLQSKFSRILAEKGWAGVGYHRTVLALSAGLLDASAEALDFIESHHLSAFPNKTDAPRNDDPTSVNTPLITPWFCHYALPVLIENGRMDFVLEQYRKCWGEYLLAEGRTTLMEVFDTRWSHCHQWAGCPTWQLSRYALGLWPRCDIGKEVFDFHLRPGSLAQAKGRLPIANGQWLNVEWTRQGEWINCRLHASCDCQIRFEDDSILSLKANETMAKEIQII